MITCPKCESRNVIRAEDEAPAWAKQYMKCFACGNRWDLAGPPPKGKRSDEEESEAETDELEPVPVKLGGDDLVARVMSGARHQPVTEKEETMGTPEHICKEIVRTGTRCTTGRAKGSDYCLRHLAKREGGGAVTATPIRCMGKWCRDDALPGTKHCAEHTPADAPVVTQLPAKRANAPIVLAEPTHLNLPAPVNHDGHRSAVQGIDDMISTYETDLATLRRAKELLERVG